jgi:hypothetical protein
MRHFDLSFPTKNAKDRFLADLNSLIEYCSDAREAEDYEENPDKDHVYQRALRVAKVVEKGFGI